MKTHRPLPNKLPVAHIFHLVLTDCVDSCPLLPPPFSNSEKWGRTNSCISPLNSMPFGIWGR
jgi:hypothetical protein